MQISPNEIYLEVGETSQVTVTDVVGTLSITNNSTDIASAVLLNGEITVVAKAEGDIHIVVTDTHEDGTKETVDLSGTVSKTATFMPLTIDGTGTETYDSNVFGRQYAVNNNMGIVYDTLATVNKKLNALISVTSGSLVVQLATLGTSIGTCIAMVNKLNGKMRKAAKEECTPVK